MQYMISGTENQHGLGRKTSCIEQQSFVLLQWFLMEMSIDP